MNRVPYDSELNALPLSYPQVAPIVVVKMRESASGSRESSIDQSLYCIENSVLFGLSLWSVPLMVCRHLK